MKSNGILILIIVLMLLGLIWEIATWQECLRQHSWWYCLRVFS